MRNIIHVLFLLFLSIVLFGQGSTALVYDGTNNNIELNSSFQNQDGTKSFSFCAWIKSTNINKTGQRVLCDDENNTKGYALSLGDPGSGRLRFYVRGLSTVSLDVPSGVYQLSNNKWYHVAAVYNQSSRTRYIYVNGEVAASHTHGVGEWNSSEVDIGSVSIGGEVNGSSESANRFQGQIDEVSYWNKALSQIEVRDLMCKSLTGSETGLYAYWNFDGASLGANNVPDITANGLTGTMTNMTASDFADSSIPLGNESIYLYPASWVGQSITLNSPSNGSLEVNLVSGNPRSVHVYRVDNVPNYTAGLSGLGNNDTYYGVFFVGGASPTYTVVYDYSSYPDALFDKNNLVLNSRANNAATTWTDIIGTNNTGINTLTKNAVSTNSKEFILSNPTSPLPIKLLSFQANLNEDKVDLRWITSTEINNDFFTIEKSVDGKKWNEVSIVAGAGNSSETIEYFESDYKPIKGISYYRLKQTDFDGTSTYSNIVPVKYVKNNKDASISLFPNPVRRGQEVKINFNDIFEEKILVVLRDTKGQEYFSKVILNIEEGALVAIPIDYSIPAGVYLVTASSENQMYSQKLLVK